MLKYFLPVDNYSSTCKRYLVQCLQTTVIIIIIIIIIITIIIMASLRSKNQPFSFASRYLIFIFFLFFFKRLGQQISQMAGDISKIQTNPQSGMWGDNTIYFFPQSFASFFSFFFSFSRWSSYMVSFLIYIFHMVSFLENFSTNLRIICGL